MKRLKTTCFLLQLASLALLVPGLTMDILQINISTEFIIKIPIFNENRSVTGTLGSLWLSANYLPFLLILLFGVVIPLVKAILVFVILLSSKPNPSYSSFINFISKWAMADVFAISILTAFLGANAMGNTKAALMPGFYWFAGYVLLSVASTILLDKMLAYSKQNTGTHSII